MERHQDSRRVAIVALAMLTSTLVCADARGEFIEAYTMRKSFEAGETIRFCVSTDAPTYSITIMRETEFELPVVAQFEGLAGRVQPVPPKMAWRGANWDVTFSATVPDAWRTGSYRARFRAEDGATTDYPFFVRPVVPGSTSRILFVANFTNREAYNAWGGKNMYNSDDPEDPGPARKVSFHRPIRLRDRKVPFMWATSLMHGSLEHAGYALEYLTEWDLHLDPCVLRAYDVVIFTGHHEYVSRRVYDAVEMHQDRGGHLLFFSGDDFSWHVRYEDDGRMLVCFRNPALDPLRGVRDCLVTTRWWDPILERPPEAMKGSRVVSYSYLFEPGDFIVQDASHWIFEGTGLENGDALGTLLAHGEGDDVAEFSPDVDVVLYAYRDVPLDPEDPPDVEYVEVTATYFEETPEYGFPDGNGGAVFAAGTLYGWMLSLVEGNPGWEDVRRVTSNLLDHMLAAPPPPPPPGRECPFHASCFLTVADLDDDYTIGQQDLLILLATWGPCDDCVADIDNDGVAGFTDLIALLANWGT